MHFRTFVATLATALAVAAGADAQVQPTISDIATCNEQATAKTDHPSALPGSRPRQPETSRQPPDAREGVPATSRPERPADRGPSLRPPASGGVGEKTDPSGAIITQSPDPLVKGMDAGRAADPAYRSAYRQCMEQRARSAR